MVEKKLYLEEIANSITHGIGLVLSLAGFAVLAFIAGVALTVALRKRVERRQEGERRHGR